MTVIAELEVTKDARDCVALPASCTFVSYLAGVFEDGHVELYPRVLADPTVSVRTVRDMDASMANVAVGKAGMPIDAAALLKALASPATLREEADACHSPERRRAK